MKPHDHNFKNLLQDFPKEALEWIFPEILKDLGGIVRIEFLRQEPKKRTLSDSHLALDMPILFSFENKQLLLWLVEFQENKAGFSIYRLLRYTTDLIETHPGVTVIPTVLFTDRRRWRKEVAEGLTSKLGDQLFLHFEYRLIKLFDFKARDYYHSRNPIVRILLPKMDYAPGERGEVILRAYQGLFELTPILLFEKYLDFIDMYAGVTEDEREDIYREIKEHKETAMLAQYIRDKGFEEGVQQGVERNLVDTILKMHRKGLSVGQIADILELRNREVEDYLKAGDSCH